jgi:peptidyl-prolyl cis-trans isomerase SurA
MFMKKTLITICSILITATIYAATESLDKIVAIVNDDVITQKEVQNRMNLIKQQFAATGNLPADNQLQQQVLDQLIDNELQLQVAKKHQITVSDSELDAAIQEIAERNHLSVEQLKQKLIADHVAYADYRKQISEEILISKVARHAVNTNISVSDEEIAKFMRENTADPASREYHILDLVVPLPDQATPQQIQQAQKTALQIIPKLRTSTDLGKTVQTYNLQQQDLDWRSISQLPAIFVAVVPKMQSGEVSQPIQAPNGWHIVKILATRNLQPKISVDQAREALYHKKLAESLKQWLQQLKTQSYIKIIHE